MEQRFTSERRELFWSERSDGKEGDRYTKVVRSSLLRGLAIDTFLRYITYHDQYDAVTEFLAEI